MRSRVAFGTAQTSGRPSSIRLAGSRRPPSRGASRSWRSRRGSRSTSRPGAGRSALAGALGQRARRGRVDDHEARTGSQEFGEVVASASSSCGWRKAEPLRSQLDHLPGVEIEDRAPGTLHHRVDEIPVSLIEYRYPLLAPPSPIADLPLPVASIDDLACMKLSA